MISTRLAGGIAAGALAVGILTGSAATIVVREVTSSNAAGVNLAASMSQMSAMRRTGSGMMTGSNGMMGAMGPSASGMPDWMRSHHPANSPEPAQ